MDCFIFVLSSSQYVMPVATTYEKVVLLRTERRMGWEISETILELLEGKPDVFKGILVCECSVWFPLA